MRSARRPADAPACGSGCRRRRARMRHQQAGHAMSSGRQRQPACRRQLCLREDTDDESEIRAPEAFLHRPQHICGPVRYGDQQARRVEAERGEARRMQPAELLRQRRWPAPQDAARPAVPRGGGIRRVASCIRSTQAQGQCEGERGGEGAGPVVAGCRVRPSQGWGQGQGRLDLVQGGRVETVRAEPAIDVGDAEPPRPRPRGLPVGCRHAAATAAALDGTHGLAQHMQRCGPCGAGRSA